MIFHDKRMYWLEDQNLLNIEYDGPGFYDFGCSDRIVWKALL